MALRRSNAHSTRLAANYIASSLKPTPERTNYPQILRTRPSSLLIPLVEFNEDVVYRRLRDLYDRQLVNRFTLPRSVGPAGEFIYYLDNPAALDLLIQRAGVSPESASRAFLLRNRAQC